MINVRVPETEMSLQPRITVIGVGGAGGNAVGNMIRSNLEGVEFLVCNTDAQALRGSPAERKLQLGLNITRGLGAGSKPEVGRAAAEEALDDILEYLEGSNMVFITAGMGGGTGSGAAPVIARAAREHGILTVGVVTKPFQFEGAHRMKNAERAIDELQQFVDTLIVIPNQNLFRIANEKTTFADAFKMADEVLHSGVRGVTDLMVMPGLINLDFADIRTVMSEMGKAMMGTGEAEGQRRAIDAAEAAISNPLLDEVSLKGAKAMLINITAGMDIALFEVDEAVNRVRAEVDPEANVIFGSTFDQSMEGRLRVSVVATGIDAALMQQPRPMAPTLSVISNGARKAATGFAPGLSAAVAAAAAAPAMGMPVTMTATALQLEPQPQAPVAMQVEVPAVAAAPVTAESMVAPSFIPPAAISAGPRPTVAAPAAARAEPMAEAELVNARPAPAPKRSSLFKTALGIGRQAAAPTAARAEPTVPSMPAHGSHGPASTPATPAQSRLSIDPQVRVKPAQESDDLLDIPAFLRRQAN
ncbi:MAG: cell division protein FtsZ [Rhodospirillales bacterium]|nr:cell division protein FtsZ [Rhodospirillales bacterium]